MTHTSSLLGAQDGGAHRISVSFRLGQPRPNRESRWSISDPAPRVAGTLPRDDPGRSGGLECPSQRLDVTVRTLGSRARFDPRQRRRRPQRRRGPRPTPYVDAGPRGSRRVDGEP